MSEDQIQPDEPERRRVRRDDEDDRPRSRRRDEYDDEDRPRRRRDDYDEEDDIGRRIRHEEGDATGGLIPYKNPQALIAYYCGVFSLVPCLGGLLGPVAIILGILGLKYRGKHPTAGGLAHAWVGIVLGSLVTLGHLGVVLLIALGAAMK